MLDRPYIYARVAAHLIAQGEPAIVLLGDDRICAYRTPSGLRCGIGVLIDADAFDPEFNGAPVVHPGVLAMLLASGLDIDIAGEDIAFLADLQAVHDSVDPQDGDWLSQVVRRLTELRQKYGLKVSTVFQVPQPELA